MRRDFDVDQLGDLLDQPLLAVLATHLRDGSARLSPVWHEWRDGAFHVAIPEGDPKLGQIGRDPRVSIVVAEGALPYRGIEVAGRAAPTADPYAATMRRLAGRYYGPGMGDLYPDSARGTVLRIDADRVRTWDFADDMAAAG